MYNPEALISRLAKGGVDFVVVGGIAAIAHGSSMMTKDLDVCIDLSPENILRLQAAIEDAAPVHRLTPAKIPFRVTPEEARGWKNLYLDTDLGQLDCLGEISGVGSFEDVYRNSADVDFYGVHCRVLTLDALIKAKEATGREHDRIVLLQLRAIHERLKS